MKDPIDAPRRYVESGAPEGKLLELLGAPSMTDAQIARGQKRLAEFASAPRPGKVTLPGWKAIALVVVAVAPTVWISRARLDTERAASVEATATATDFVTAARTPEIAPVAPASPNPSVPSPNAVTDVANTAPSFDVANLPSAMPAARVTEGRAPASSTNMNPTATPSDRLARELGLVDGARTRLASDPAGALREANRHASEFPDGQLASEREVIAVDALLRLGQLERARARGRAYFERAPHSSAARRIDSLLRGAAADNLR